MIFCSQAFPRSISILVAVARNNRRNAKVNSSSSAVQTGARDHRLFLSRFAVAMCAYAAKFTMQPLLVSCIVLIAVAIYCDHAFAGAQQISHNNGISTEGCGVSATCYGFPASCASTASTASSSALSRPVPCEYLTSFYRDASPRGPVLKFTIQGVPPKDLDFPEENFYVSTGFSPTGNMNKSLIISCIYDAAASDKVFLHGSYAHYKKAPKRKVEIESQLGNTVGTYVNGILTCAFELPATAVLNFNKSSSSPSSVMEKQQQTTSSAFQVVREYNLSQPLYLEMARGYASGECLGYHYTERFVTKPITVAASSNGNYAVLEHFVPSPAEKGSALSSDSAITTSSPISADANNNENIISKGSVFPVTILHDDQQLNNGALQQQAVTPKSLCGVKVGCVGYPSSKCISSNSCEVLVMYSMMPDSTAATNAQKVRRRRAVTSTGPTTMHDDTAADLAAATAAPAAVPVYNVDFNRQRVLFRIISRRPKSATAEGWYAAVGFNTQQAMPGADIVECIAPAAGGTPKRIVESRAEALKLPVRYTSNLLGDVDVSTASDGDADMIECSFSYPLGKPVGIAVEDDANSTSVRRLGENVYMLVATGPLAGANGGEIGYHDGDKLVTAELIDLKFVGVSNSDGRDVSLLIKLHAGLMVGAWMLLASLGVFFGRYFKSWHSESEPCGIKLWFFFHRPIQLLVVCVTIAAFVLMVVELRTLRFVTLPNPHPIIGFAVTILALLQPLIAFCRPHPNTRFRPLFNAIHFVFGWSAYIGALVAIGYGMRLEKFKLHPLIHLLYYAFAVYIILFDIIMEIHSADVRRYVGRPATYHQMHLLSAHPPSSNGYHHSNGGHKPDYGGDMLNGGSGFASNYGNCFKTCIIIMHFIIIAACTAAVEYGIFAREHVAEIFGNDDRVYIP